MMGDLRILVLCTVEAGLDAVAEVLRQGGRVAGVVGLRPESVKPEAVSGWTDVGVFCQRWNLPFHYVERYDLKSEADQALFAGLDFNLVWVAGWQRLIPAWLLEQAGARQDTAFRRKRRPASEEAGRGRIWLSDYGSARPLSIGSRQGEA